jgi:hypothetical protein
MKATDAEFELVKNVYFGSRYAERRLKPGV